MTEEQIETIKRFAKFIRDSAKKTAVSAYNSDLVQGFIREYTGDKLKEKLKNGRVKVIEGSKEAYEFMKPRVKIAGKKAVSATKEFVKFSKKAVKSAKESQIYKDFMASKLVAKCRKYGRKAIVGTAIAGAVFLGGKIAKNRYDYLNSDEYKMEICKKNEPILFLTIVHSEDWSDSSYDDGAGVPTTGYGTTIYKNGNRVKLNDKNISRTLSQEEIDRAGGSIKEATFLKGEGEVIAHLEKYVYPSMLKVKNFQKLKQEQQIALALFCYNVGCGAFDESSVLSELNKGHIDKAFENILKYNKMKDKKGRLVYARGLQKRRTYEYMIATGQLPLSQILDMPVSSLYSDEAYCKLYAGKTAKDFAGENIVKPVDKNNDYVRILKQGKNSKVRDKISKKTCQEAEAECIKMAQQEQSNGGVFKPTQRTS